MNQTEKEKQEYVSLPYFGLPKLIPYLKPYRWNLLAMVLFGLLTSAIDIIVPLFQQYALNNFIGLGKLDGLTLFIFAYLLVLTAQILFSILSTFQCGKVEMYVGRDMKKASFDHLQTLSFSYFNQNSVGYVHARVMSDTSRVGGMVSSPSVWG